MAFRGLSNFQMVDILRFLSGKELEVTEVREWIDYSSKESLGIKIEVAITKDVTNYGEGRENISNLYNKFWVKIPKKISVPLHTKIELVNPIAKVYGEYNDQLSVVADDIKVVSK